MAKIVTEDKHQAFMGVYAGLKKAREFIGLRRITLVNQTALEFEFFHRFNDAVYFSKIHRIYKDENWQPAPLYPYEAGKDAGEEAARWLKSLDVPIQNFTEKKVNYDPEIERWTKDIREQA